MPHPNHPNSSNSSKNPNNSLGKKREEEREEEEIIVFKDVTFRYPTGKEPTLHKVNFSVRRGESITLIGPNGGGKTTCLFLITGLLQPQSGTIRLMGKPLHSTKSLINGVFQKNNIQHPSFPIRVKEFICLGGIELPRALRETRATQCLESLELTHLAKKTLSELSTGQRQRMFIARALMNDAPILLFDEPTANLDSLGEKLFYTILKKLRAQKKTILLVSHDVSVAPTFSDKIFCINQTLHAVTHADFKPETLKELYTPTVTVMEHSHYTP